MVRAKQSNVLEREHESPHAVTHESSSIVRIRTSDIVTVVIFCLSIAFMSALTFISSPEEVSTDENRELAKFPKLHRKRLPEFPRQFEEYFNDRVAFRGGLVKARNLIKYRIFGDSTGPLVAVGRNGFLFYLGEQMERLCTEEGPLPSPHLKEWTIAVTERQQSLSAKGIRYIFAIAPEKPSIYPELLPPVLSPLGRLSCLDQVKASLNRDSVSCLLDLRGVLTKAKQTNLVYFKTDTHWTHFGAHVAYNEMMSRLRSWFPQLEPCLTEQQVGLQMLPETNGDCAKLMGLAHCIPERAPKSGSKFLDTCPKELLDRRFTGERRDRAAATLPTALILHDSFGYALKPYFYRHFKCVRIRWQQAYKCDEELLKEYKPDVVVQLLAERRLLNDLPFHSNDWRSWLIRNIGKERASNRAVWLNILPNSQFINVDLAKQIDHLGAVNPTTSRKHTRNGDEVSFTADSALWFDWYLLKGGDQGVAFADASSKSAYERLQEFVQSSGNYRCIDSFVLPNGEELFLYKRKM